MKANIITWALSVVAACIIGGAWVYTHPQPRIARVDMNALFADQKASFQKMLKPGMTDQEQAAVLETAKKYAVHLNQAVKQISAECRCAVLNSDALLEMPNDASLSGIHDYTARARQIIETAK